MIHHVYANRSNIGDWLSARGIQSTLSQFELTEHLCDEPFVPETLAALANAGENDLVIVGGGGLFMDYFTPFWRGFESIASRFPFVIWGAGCCALKREQSLPPVSLIRDVVAQSALCVVRDQLTFDWLEHPRVLPPIVCPSILAVNTAAPRRRGTVLHADNLDNVGEAAYQHMIDVTAAFADRTGRDISVINNEIRAGARGALNKALDQYSASEMVVTGRLHGCIIALATGRPVLAVSGDYKVESFMTAAGLAEWVLDFRNVGSFATTLAGLSAQASASDFIEHHRELNRQVGAAVEAFASGDAERSALAHGRLIRGFTTLLNTEPKV